MQNQPPPANPPDDKKNVVLIELPAPVGWRKQFIPQKGGTPRRKDVVFISPTGEEIKSKRQLELYMKSHPGGPSTSEFDWGTGDTPRRSSRLTDKSKAVESPESESPKKRQRKSGSKKAGKGKKEDSDGDAEIIEMIEEKEVTEGAKGSVDVAMEDAKDIGDKGEVVIEAATDKENVKYTDQNANEGEEVKEAALADEDNVKDTEQKIEDKVDDASLVDAPENQETADKSFETKEEGSETKSVQTPVVEDNNKEAEKGADPKDSSQLPMPMPRNASSSDQGAESVKEAVPEVSDAQAENKEAEKELEAPTELPEPSVVPLSEQEAENLTDAVPEVADTKVEESKIAENVNDAVPEGADPKAEESKNAEVGQEDHQNKEAPEIAVRCT